ncbi:hypothetical protein OAU26_07525 [Mariniblastus sp.]|nr:hypothetical protein [Mariniblastus sp.]
MNNFLLTLVVCLGLLLTGCERSEEDQMRAVKEDQMRAVKEGQMNEGQMRAAIKRLDKLSEKREAVWKVRDEVNATGKMTDSQAKYLANNSYITGGGIRLTSLTSITDAQAEILSGGVDIIYLDLRGLTSLTDAQAEIFSDGGVESLWLNGLTFLTDAQAESLSKLNKEEQLFVSSSLQEQIDRYRVETAEK